MTQLVKETGTINHADLLNGRFTAGIPLTRIPNAATREKTKISQIENLTLAFCLYDTLSDDGIHTDVNVGLFVTETNESMIDSIGNPDSISYRKYLHDMLDDFLNECAKIK